LVWVGVVVIGGVGAVLRFVIDGAVSRRNAGAFPLGTFTVNVTGAALLGLVTGVVLGHDGALLAGTAAVGSFTTFSTWMLETHRLTEGRRGLLAGVNVLASLLAGIGAAALGQWIGGYA
jgi:CrcB protein